MHSHGNSRPERTLQEGYLSACWVTWLHAAAQVDALARARPGSVEELLALKGVPRFSRSKRETYGADIVAALAQVGGDPRLHALGNPHSRPLLLPDPHMSVHIRHEAFGELLPLWPHPFPCSSTGPLGRWHVACRLVPGAAAAAVMHACVQGHSLHLHLPMHVCRPGPSWSSSAWAWPARQESSGWTRAGSRCAAGRSRPAAARGPHGRRMARGTPTTTLTSAAAAAASRGWEPRICLQFPCSLVSCFPIMPCTQICLALGAQQQATADSLFKAEEKP